ncbi:MAG: molybdopterin dinucleotide binding domain-containing protein, partial [Acidimicrobiales bacterium]
PPPRVPAVDSYSLRLVAARRLYDGGSAVASSPSLTPLVPEAVARANPYDLDRLGAVTGDRVRVRSARGALELPAEADGTVPRGVVAVDFNLAAPGGAANAAAVLIDAEAAVTEVRLESLS